MPPKPHRYLSVNEKLDVLKELDKGKSYRAIAAHYGIATATVTNINAKRKVLEEERDNNKNLSKKICKRATELDDVNILTMEFFKRCRSKNISLSGPVIQAKAKEYADTLGISEFSASSGWLDKFKQRNNVMFRVLSGESACADIMVVGQWKENLPEILKGYDLENIFNTDETALFYRQMPSKSLVEKGEAAKGVKLAKERITVLFCCSATGEKLKPIMIGNSLNPRAFKKANVKPQNLPVTWKANKTAWMTTFIFTEWLETVNKQMKFQKRKILILLDNATCHPDINLSNVKLLFLPLNLTTELQPLDQGIIRNAKSLYRKNLLSRLVSVADTCASATEYAKSVTAYDAICWMNDAWKNVKILTIRKCFERCGIRKEESSLEVDLESDYIDIFNGIPEHFVNEFGSAKDFVSIDDNVVCTAQGGNTMEEIFSDVLDMVTKPGEQQAVESDDDEPEVVDFPVISYSGVLERLHELERYVNSTDSHAVDMLHSFRRIVEKEQVAKKLSDAAKLNQPTIDKFFKRL